MDHKRNLFENFSEITFEQMTFPKSSQKLKNKQFFLFQIPKNVRKFRPSKFMLIGSLI